MGLSPPGIGTEAPGSPLEAAGQLLPGLALAALVAALAVGAARLVPLPAMVIALIIGIALHGIAARPAFAPGLRFAVRTLLRWAVALLGLRVALGEIWALGPGAALLVIGVMAATVAAGFLLARTLRQPSSYGALAGAATAVCGASAALATSTVLPPYPGRDADTAFAVVAANALSTVAMLLYPALAAGLGLGPEATGILLGATIHDVAQVVGAGYAVSEPVGNVAVVVKLFRVLLLLPVVLVIGWWLAREAALAEGPAARVPVPTFALMFLLLCAVNSAMPMAPALAPLYAPVRALLVEASSLGLVIAIAALGLTTAPKAVAALGWRHGATMIGTSLVILLGALLGLALIG